jgi:hypothetical protein
MWIQECIYLIFNNVIDVKYDHFWIYLFILFAMLLKWAIIHMNI